MIIRKAKQEDYKEVASHILLAMDQLIYLFIQEHSKEKAIGLMESLVRQNGNQYSYENCWVADENGILRATAVVYNGADLYELRVPVAAELRSRFDVDFNPEDETQPGEYYIDCIGVSPDQQGRGIGSRLLQFLIGEYVQHRNLTLGLLVEHNNSGAKKLYIQSGFKKVGKKMLAGKLMEHLQYSDREKLRSVHQ